MNKSWIDSGVLADRVLRQLDRKPWQSVFEIERVLQVGEHRVRQALAGLGRRVKHKPDPVHNNGGRPAQLWARRGS